jgi:hypothetical protein
MNEATTKVVEGYPSLLNKFREPEQEYGTT